MILYNYGINDADGTNVVEHQAHPCIPGEGHQTDCPCTGAGMSRSENTKTIIYDFNFPAHSLGRDAFTAGWTFGLGYCVNDGDIDGSGGIAQAGWGG